MSVARMRRSSLAQILGAVALAWLGTASFGGAAEPLQPPAGWLATLELRSLTDGEEFIGAVLDDLGYELASPLTAAFRVMGIDPAAFGDGPLTVGVAAGPSREPYPFVLLTPPDFDDLVRALGGERTGNAAVVEFAGFEIGMRPFGDGVIAAPLDFLPAAKRLKENESQRDVLASAARLSVSRDCLTYLARRSRTFSKASRAAARKVLLSRWRWPPRLHKVDAVVGMNTPFWEAASQQCEGMQLTVNRTEGGNTSIRLRLSLANKLAPTAPPEPTGDSLSVKQASITEVRAVLREPYVKELLKLLTAFYQGRPDLIEASRFAAQPYAVYKARLFETAALLNACEARVLLPDGDDPVFSNRIAVLHTADAKQLLSLAADLADSWNGLIKASEAKTRVLFVQRELDRNGRQGLEFAADMVLAAGVKDTPEIRQLLAGFVGENGWQVIRLIPLDDRRVLYSEAPWKQTLAEATRLKQAPAEQDTPPAASGVIATGVWRVDRYLAWTESIRQLEQADVLGFRPAKPMRESAPLHFEVKAKGQRLEATATLPHETIQAFGAYLRAN